MSLSFSFIITILAVMIIMVPLPFKVSKSIQVFVKVPLIEIAMMTIAITNAPL